MPTTKLQVLMRYGIPFNFMFQLFIQSAFSQCFIQVKKKSGKNDNLFCNRPLHTEFDENTLSDLLNEDSHKCVPFHL
jgi:hypothetical protein